MAFEIPGFKHSLEANADLSASQYHAVRLTNPNPLTGTGRVIIQTQAGDDSTIGILQNKPQAQGEAAEIMSLPGITKWVVGAGSVQVGSLVTSDANGKCQTATGGQVVLGHALQAVSGGGDEIISVLIGVTFIQVGG